MSDDAPTRELTEQDLPECYNPNWDELERTTSEEPFMRDSFYLLREALHWMTIIAGSVPTVPLDRNRAIIRGLVVRQTKLLRLLVRELASRETFLQLSLGRFVLENIGTLLYLLQDNGDGSRFEQYVQNGLIAERELLAEIQRNVDNRAGEVWPIEERMRRSVASTAGAAGIDDVSALPGRAKIGFPSAEARVKLLGPAAYISYRKGSGEAHGDWADLYRNHLEFDGTNFTPNLDNFDVRPQLPLMITLLTARTMLENANAMIDNHGIAEGFRHVLIGLYERAHRVDELHEQFMHARRWETSGGAN